MTKIQYNSHSRKHSHHRLLLISSITLIALAVLLFIWSYLAQIEELRERYAQLQEILTHWENTIASLDNKWMIILVVMLLFALKSIVALYPMSALFIITGMVFDVQYATAINIVGLALLISIGFFRGNRFGGGGVQKLISRFSIVNEFMKLDGDGNPWMLFIARLVPTAPVNIVSRLYGASKIKYDKYLLISLLGFAPRLLSYSVLGNHVFDPFSVGFLAPIIILFALSGVSLLMLYLILRLVSIREDKEDKDDIHHERNENT